MKSNFKNSIYGALGFILPLLITLLLTPYMVHKLSPEIYGIYILSSSLMGLMSFMDLGLGQGIIKFVAEYEAKKDFVSIKNVISTSLSIYMVMGVAGAIIIYIFADSLASLFKVNDRYKTLAIYVFHITALGFFINFITSIFAYIPHALQRYDISTKIRVTILLLLSISIVWLLYMDYGLKEIMISSVIFGVIKLAVYFVIFRRMLPEVHFKIWFDYNVFKKIFSFSMFTAINSITGNIVFRIDKMIISSFLGTVAVTYYTIPFMMIQAGFSLVGSFMQFLFPAVSSLSSLGLKDTLNELYKNSLRYTAILSSILTIIFITSGESFLTLWMGTEFALQAKKLVPILAVIFFFHCLSIPAFYTYNGLGYPKVNMISSFIGSSLYLIVALKFIPLFGLIGASLSFAFSLLPSPFYFYYLHKIIGIKNNKEYGILFVKSTIIVCIGFVLSFLVPKLPHVEKLIINIIILLSYAIALSSFMTFLLGLLSKEDIKVIFDKIRRGYNYDEK